MDMDNKGNTRNQFLYGLLFAAICAAACYVILFHPIPRQIGLLFRNTLYVFPLIFLTALIYSLCQNRLIRVIFASLLFAAVCGSECEDRDSITPVWTEEKKNRTICLGLLKAEEEFGIIRTGKERKAAANGYTGL